MKHGLKIKAVYRTIDYPPRKIFKWFVEQVTVARRTRDTDKSKEIFAEMFKLLGNSACGKMIENLKRQTDVDHDENEKVVDEAMHSVWLDI